MHIFHRWTKWSDPEPGIASAWRWRDGTTKTINIVVQTRKCTKCNKSEIREVS